PTHHNEKPRIKTSLCLLDKKRGARMVFHQASPAQFPACRKLQLGPPAPTAMDVTGFQSLTRKKKMLELDNTHPSGIPVSRIVGLLVGIALLVATLILPAPGGMSEPAWKAAGLMFLLAAWWSTEAIPIPATSLLPIVLVPALGLGTVAQATTPYANPTIFLFMGG